MYVLVGKGSLAIFLVLASNGAMAAPTLAEVVQRAGEAPILDERGEARLIAVTDELLVVPIVDGHCEISRSHSRGAEGATACFRGEAAEGRVARLQEQHRAAFTARLQELHARAGLEEVGPTEAVKWILGPSCQGCDDADLTWEDFQQLPSATGEPRFGDLALSEDGGTLMVVLGPWHGLLLRKGSAPALVLLSEQSEPMSALGTRRGLEERGEHAALSDAELEDVAEVTTRGMPSLIEIRGPKLPQPPLPPRSVLLRLSLPVFADREGLAPGVAALLSLGIPLVDRGAPPALWAAPLGQIGAAWRVPAAPEAIPADPWPLVAGIGADLGAAWRLPAEDRWLQARLTPVFRWSGLRPARGTAQHLGASVSLALELRAPGWSVGFSGGPERSWVSSGCLGEEAGWVPTLGGSVGLELTTFLGG